MLSTAISNGYKKLKVLSIEISHQVVFMKTCTFLQFFYCYFLYFLYLSFPTFSLLAKMKQASNTINVSTFAHDLQMERKQAWLTFKLPNIVIIIFKQPLMIFSNIFIFILIKSIILPIMDEGHLFH